MSNSSSSSFIVAFPRIPVDANDLREMLLGDAIGYSGHYTSEVWSAMEVADFAWNSMNGELDEEQVCAEFESGHINGDPEYPVDMYDEGVSQEERRKRYQEWQDKLIAHRHEKAKKFMEQTPDTHYYQLEFGDECGGLEAAMEHGDLFQKLPHYVISNH